MKYVITAVLTVVVGWTLLRVSLDDDRLQQFIQAFEAASSAPDATAMCALIDPKASIHIRDRTQGGEMDRRYTRAELCEYLQQVLPLQSKFVADMRVERRQLQIERSFWTPWQATVSYVETRHVTNRSPPLHSQMHSNDRLVLQRSFSGLRIHDLDSDTIATFGPGT